MSSTQDPLLPSFPPKTKPKLIRITLSLTTLILLSTFIITNFNNPHPNILCARAANRTACDTIVSALSPIQHDPIRVINSVISHSQTQLDRDNQFLSEDCAVLLHLSRDRLIDSATAIAAGRYADARTWLSAVLTNHVTCIDTLNTSSTHLNSLVELASTALSVLNAVEASRNIHVDEWNVLEDSFEVNVTVAADGSGDYTTVQEAVDSVPPKGKYRYVIYVKNGTYRENVTVAKNKKNVMIVGDGMDSTVITCDHNVIDGWSTFNSSTLTVSGDGFILQDICIRNTAGPEKHQAVALRVSADKSVINRCKIEGYQDTLYAHSLRQFYRDSIISGTIDFIFGNAAAVFQNCQLIARQPMSNQKNLVTAQGRTDPNQNTGISIQNCEILPSPELLQEAIPTFLGRPWKNFSRTVYMESYIDSHVNPKGWLEWDGDFGLDTLYYGEFENVGPGAGVGGRVNWTGYHVIVDPNVASDFTVAKFIQGEEEWLKATGVDFTEGL